MTCGQGAKLRGDSCFSLLTLPVVHGNEQFGLKCEALLLSLSSAVSGSRTVFICNLISTQSARITLVVVFSNALLREEALQSEAHLAKYINVGRGGKSLKASLVQLCNIKIYTTSIKYTQIVYSLFSTLAALLWFLNRI